LVDFLSEALYQSQVNREVYKDIVFKKLTDTEMEGLLMGQKIERFGEEIKAVTYHSLKINKKEDGSWEAIVLFDI
jgi:SHS2 domain-containing protein